MADKILSIADGLHDELPSITTAKAGRILITTDRGEMYYEPEDKKRIQVNPQADWQQNDETANDYVKNRPGGYDVLTEILPETTLNFTDSNNLTLTNCPPIEVGKKYIVTFDGTEYELVGKLGNIDYACIGNESFTWGSIDTGEPFLIYFDIIYGNNAPDISISSSTTLPCTYNIKIKAATPIKINEKYLDIKNTNIINGSKTGSLRTVGSSEESSEYYTIGDYSFAEGYNTKASGNSSHAEGWSTIASGNSSHAEGGNTTASGFMSHAEGYYTKASGSNSHAEGNYTTASGSKSHAEGSYTTASGSYSHAECGDTTALGRYSHAEGNNTVAGQMGFKVTACEKLTDTTGTYTLTSITGLSEYQRYSVHLSSSKEDCGEITAIDTTNKKITVDGYPDIALSTSSSSTANYLTIVDKPKLGDIFIKGEASHAEGDYTKASGSNSHAEGNSTTASGNNSHAEGSNTKASGNYQHVQGKYNIADTDNAYADIIGNGSSKTNRSNAATVDWNGNAWYAGDVYVGSTSGTNKDEGSKKLATEEYIDTQIGNINTALDSIIEIQNSLIGGN